MGNLAAEPTSPRYHLSIARVHLHCVWALISLVAITNFQHAGRYFTHGCWASTNYSATSFRTHVDSSFTCSSFLWGSARVGRERAKYFFDSPRHCRFRYWLLSRLTRSVTYSFNQTHGELVTFPVPCFGLFWPASWDYFYFWRKLKYISYIL